MAHRKSVSRVPADRKDVVPSLRAALKIADDALAEVARSSTPKKPRRKPATTGKR